MNLADRSPVDLATPLAPAAGRNPFLVALAVFGGLAWLVALMLWNVHAQITDYTSYDVAAAEALTGWIAVLVITGAAAVVGSLVVAGVGHELRRTPRR